MFTKMRCNWMVVLVVMLGVTQQVSGDDRGPTSGKDPAPGFLREMRFLDVDRDRQIDARELAQGQQMAAVLLSLSWEELDSDGDGTVSHSEFEAAANRALQTQTSAEEDADLAEDELFDALSPGLLLSQLSEKEEYAEELAALREAVEDLDDHDTVVTQVIKNPKLYPRLYPVVYTYARHYPHRPAWQAYVKAQHRYHYRHPLGHKAQPKTSALSPKAKPAVKPKVNGKPAKSVKPPKSDKPRKSTGPKRGGRGRP
ncbi:MAG: hypothetical protein ABIG44_03755 [Planctomycetota bacterium]